MSASYCSVSLQSQYCHLSVYEQAELFKSQADEVYKASLRAITAEQLHDYSKRMQLILLGLQGLEKKHAVPLISFKGKVSALQAEIDKNSLRTGTL